MSGIDGGRDVRMDRLRVMVMPMSMEPDALQPGEKPDGEQR